jgi:hypothetical protein
MVNWILNKKFKFKSILQIQTTTIILSPHQLSIPRDMQAASSVLIPNLLLQIYGHCCLRVHTYPSGVFLQTLEDPLYHEEKINENE